MLKVFALLFLSKGDAIAAFKVYNTAIKFEVIDNSKLLLFFS